jgi:hypothetical protein
MVLPPFVMLQWWYFPSNTTLQFTGVFILSLAATCFGHLFGHLQVILESAYFLFTLLYLQYTYTYTTTVIRDLLCSMGKLLVMVGSLQVTGAGCYLLFIRHYEWLFCLVVLILLFSSVCLVYFTVDARCSVYVVLQLVDRCWSLSLYLCGYLRGQWHFSMFVVFNSASAYVWGSHVAARDEIKTPVNCKVVFDWKYHHHNIWLINTTENGIR